jgi:hypothetical protein
MPMVNCILEDVFEPGDIVYLIPKSLIKPPFYSYSEQMEYLCKLGTKFRIISGRELVYNRTTEYIISEIGVNISIFYAHEKFLSRTIVLECGKFISKRSRLY